MSSTQGNLLVDGMTESFGTDLFVTEFPRVRKPAWVCETCCARFDPKPSGFDKLHPPLGRPRFVFNRADVDED